MAHWRVEATVDGGVISLHLDEYLTNIGRVEFLLQLSERALAHVDKQGRRTGELFCDLLTGRLRTNVSSPIDYLQDPE